MKGDPYKMGKIATKSAMEMKTSYKMKEAMAKMKKEDDSSMKKYKSDAQRKAVHASKAERGMTMKKEEAMKMKKPLKAAKPDYIDLDGDGNKTESMKKAAADKKSPAKQGHGGRSEGLGPVKNDKRITSKKKGTSAKIGPQESPEAIEKKRKAAREETKGPSGTVFDASDKDFKRDQKERKDYSEAKSFVKMKKEAMKMKKAKPTKKSADNI